MTSSQPLRNVLPEMWLVGGLILMVPDAFPWHSVHFFPSSCHPVATVTELYPICWLSVAAFLAGPAVVGLLGLAKGAHGGETSGRYIATGGGCVFQGLWFILEMKSGDLESVGKFITEQGLLSVDLPTNQPAPDSSDRDYHFLPSSRGARIRAADNVLNRYGMKCEPKKRNPVWDKSLRAKTGSGFRPKPWDERSQIGILIFVVDGSGQFIGTDKESPPLVSELCMQKKVYICTPR